MYANLEHCRSIQTSSKHSRSLQFFSLQFGLWFIPVNSPARHSIRLSGFTSKITIVRWSPFWVMFDSNSSVTGSRSLYKRPYRTTAVSCMIESFANTTPNSRVRQHYISEVDVHIINTRIRRTPTNFSEHFAHSDKGALSSQLGWFHVVSGSTFIPASHCCRA